MRFIVCKLHLNEVDLKKINSSENSFVTMPLSKVSQAVFSSPVFLNLCFCWFPANGLQTGGAERPPETIPLRLSPRPAHPGAPQEGVGLGLAPTATPGYSSVDLTTSAGPRPLPGKLSLCSSSEISTKLLPLVSGRKRPEYTAAQTQTQRKGT